MGAGELLVLALSTRAPGGGRRNCRPMSWLTVLVDFAGFDEAWREKPSSEECRPVCTRKPKPSPRGVAGRLEDKPHLTWADPGIWNEAWPSGPREVAAGPGPATLLSHVSRCWLPPNQTGVGGGGREGASQERRAGGFPLCVHRPVPGGNGCKEADWAFGRDSQDPSVWIPGLKRSLSSCYRPLTCPILATRYPCH